MPATDGATPPGRRRRRALAGVTLLAVVAVVVVAIVATGRGRHTPGRSHRTAAVTATVSRRNLVTSQDETGKISYARSSTVANRLQGTLTWVAGVGHVVYPGQRLFDVDNFPVILMNGTTPAYRTLDSSDSPGPDIQQLNADLIDLGFDPDGIVDDDEWQPATTDGVEAFQEAHGEPETGSLTLGAVVFMRGAQRVAALQSNNSSVSDDAPDEHDEFVSYTPPSTTTGASTTPTTATTTTTETTTSTPTTSAHTPSPGGHTPSEPGLSRLDTAISRLETQVGQLQRQNQQLTRKLDSARSHTPSKRPSHGSDDSGPPSGGDSPVMTTTSTTLVVTAEVSAGEQSVTRVGARVPVVMPSGAKVYGRVVRIGQVSSSGGSSQVPITIHLDKHENGRNLDQATVSVKFVKKVARHVLSVPVTALIARPGGRYALQEAGAPHKLIDVTLGTFSTGYVQVSGRGLHAGLTITESQG